MSGPEVQPAYFGFVLSALFGTKAIVNGALPPRRPPNSAPAVVKVSAECYMKLKTQVKGTTITMAAVVNSCPEIAMIAKALQGSLPCPGILQLVLNADIREALGSEIDDKLDPDMTNRGTDVAKAAKAAQAESRHMGTEDFPLFGGRVLKFLDGCLQQIPSSGDRC